MLKIGSSNPLPKIYSFYLNKNILNTGVQSFIRNFSSNDILSVLLQKQHFNDVANKELVQQLESRQKCQKKLPTWYRTASIYYPPKLAIEQSSSESTALYKAELVSGDSLADITGGFGVDSYFLSRSIKEVFYCESQHDLAETAAHNFHQLGAFNINVHKGDGLAFLQNQQRNFDWVYLDPSRRKSDKSRVFILRDAVPSLPDSLEIIWQKTDNILIKTSPLLDISQGIENLVNVKEVHVVAVENEVKELLWVLEKEYEKDVQIIAANIKRSNGEIFKFKKSEEKAVISELGPPSTYIYEPNSAILKAGAFKILGKNLGLKKLHEHSHLYTSEKLIDFPGKRYRNESVMNFKPREFKKLGMGKASIKTRNFPGTVEELKKKFNIKDGGNTTLFFTTNLNDQLIIIICSRV